MRTRSRFSSGVKRPGLRSLAALAALALVIIACAGDDGAEESPEGPAETAGEAAEQPEEDGRSGGTLRVVPHETIVALDPHGAQSADRPTIMAARHLFDSLVAFEDGEFVPSLATSWENPDDTTWVFTLRDDAEFHDGTPVTAADAKASLERLIELGGPFSGQWALLEEAEATDDHTLTLRTSSPDGTVLSNLSIVAVAPAAGLDDPDFFSAPTGSGPFEFESFRPDELLVLVPNEDYWGGMPQIDRLEFVDIPEISSRVTALETGEVDVIWAIPPDQVPVIESMSDVSFDAVPSFIYYLTWFNNEREPFTDVRVRQAMWHAVNFDAIIDDLFPGAAQASTSLIPSTVFGHAPQSPYEYDPERAQDLLAEAGYPDGIDVTIDWASECCPQIREKIQAMISDWAAVGIQVEPLEKERAVWLDDLLALNWDMNTLNNAVLTGDADFTLGRLYHSRNERLGLYNDEVDDLLDAAKSSLDQDERLELYAQVNEILWSEAVGIFPMDILANYAWRDRVEDLTLDPNQVPTFEDVVVRD